MSVVKYWLQKIKDWPERARKAEYSVHKLARACNVSPRSLERFFRDSMATTPQQWLRLQKLMQAKSVLLESPSIKEAAESLGYRQPSHFSREFKKYHGQAPSSYLAEGPTVSSIGDAEQPKSHLDKDCRV